VAEKARKAAAVTAVAASTRAAAVAAAASNGDIYNTDDCGSHGFFDIWSSSSMAYMAAYWHTCRSSFFAVRVRRTSQIAQRSTKERKSK
jgi:hypothetical protein